MTQTLTALCGLERHDPCHDRRLWTTGHCECPCHVRPLRPEGPALLVLPVTFHPLRAYITHRDDVHDVLHVAKNRLEAIASGDGWMMLGDVERDDKGLPPNGYARRLLDALNVRPQHYLGGSIVVAGADEEGALADVPALVVAAARNCNLITTARYAGEPA